MRVQWPLEYHSILEGHNQNDTVELPQKLSLLGFRSFMLFFPLPRFYAQEYLTDLNAITTHASYPTVFMDHVARTKKGGKSITTGSKTNIFRGSFDDHRAHVRDIVMGIPARWNVYK